MDVRRAADLYAQGWTLRQIGAELGLTATTVSQQLQRARRHVGGADANDNVGDRNYLVLAKPNVTMNDIRPRPGGCRQDSCRSQESPQARADRSEP